jgi:hypothetical protein
MPPAQHCEEPQSQEQRQQGSLPTATRYSHVCSEPHFPSCKMELCGLSFRPLCNGRAHLCVQV